MHIMLYDESLWGNFYRGRYAILFYINNSHKTIYRYYTWDRVHNYFAQLDQNRVFRGQLELIIDHNHYNGAKHYFCSSFTTPVFRLMRNPRLIQVSQTVLMAEDCERIADDTKVKEILNTYSVSEEPDPFFNVYDTIKAMNQCKDADTLKLYELSALPYLHNCPIEAIMQFTDVYNNKLWEILNR